MRPFPSRNNRVLVCKADCGRKSDSNSLPIPKGLRPEAQGCEERATLGQRIRKTKNPNGVSALVSVAPRASQPRWGCFFYAPLTYPRVARSLRPWVLLRNPVGFKEKVLFQNLITKPDLRTRSVSPIIAHCRSSRFHFSSLPGHRSK